MPTDGDLPLKLTSFGQKECVRPFRAACDEFSRGR